MKPQAIHESGAVKCLEHLSLTWTHRLEGIEAGLVPGVLLPVAVLLERADALNETRAGLTSESALESCGGVLLAKVLRQVGLGTQAVEVLQTNAEQRTASPVSGQVVPSLPLTFADP